MTRKRLIVVGALIGALLSVIGWICTVETADATTGKCAGHIATLPRVTDVTDGVTTIQGAGQIGGCPKGLDPVTATITVCLETQAADMSWWPVPDPAGCAGPLTGYWTRYWKYPRQIGTTVTANCTVGAWRTEAWGTDADGTPWDATSGTVVMVHNDSGVCGINTGGGD